MTPAAMPADSHDRGGHAHGAQPSSGNLPGSLTPRELEALVALADGSTGRAAAHRLGIGYQTMKGYLTTAYRRLGTDSLVGAYQRLGWLRVPR